ncbi:MAG: hypothetical protein A3E57_01375 [Candidatus Muproteobacteria bacterium RIFCSPHIGHO2_12_FULL_60_33]|nr:MAG: hypothetical protein A3E57_01375 [Candidatus Muproteobacteria bacterium RIFCSPHIGHO2_12_FULL_60_33]
MLLAISFPGYAAEYESIFLLYAYPPGEELIKGKDLPRRELIGAWSIKRQDSRAASLTCEPFYRVNQEKARAFHRKQLQRRISPEIIADLHKGPLAGRVAEIVTETKLKIANLDKWHYYSQCVTANDEPSIAEVLNEK